MEREMQATSSRPSLICCSHSRQHRVRPFSCGNGESYLEEIRPNRVLHIQHINPQPRDPQFEKEMHVQKIYRKSGFRGGPSANGPLTIPRRKAGETIFPSKEVILTSLPNSVQSHPGESHRVTQKREEPVNSGTSSASRVNLALHNETSLQLQDKQLSHSIPDLLKMQSVPSDNLLDKNPLRPQMQKKNKEWEYQGNVESILGKNKVSVVPSESGKPSEVSCVNNKMASCTQTSVVIFFLHGVGGSSDVWQSQMHYFSREGYEIVAPDLIGHGFSCIPDNAQAYHFKEIGADLEEIFDKYCKKKNVIIGHSYGCSFACLLARLRPRLVHKLVLISGGDPSPLAPQPGIFSLPICLLCCIRPCLNCGFQKNAFHKTHKMAQIREEAFSIPTYVLQHTMNGQDWPDGDEVFHQWLVCPVLLIYGEKDKLVSLDEEKATAQAIFDSHLEVIQEAGHMVMMEAPAEVNRLIHNFLVEHTKTFNHPALDISSELITLE